MSKEASTDTAAPATTGALPGLDLAALQRWLRSNRPELLGDTPLTAHIIEGGRSNLTYRIDGATGPWVLRRPPLGHVQKTAHDMAREFRVITALGDTAVPVPRTILFVDDPASGVELPFYLMQRVDGVPLKTRADNASYSPEQLEQLSLDLAATLAALHSIDPASVGLDDFGKADGFLRRQLDRWGRQYVGSHNRELPELDRLQHELRVDVPETIYTSIVHGDYRLDNALVAADESGQPRITAVLDWEMATLGDSLTDLGLLGLYWQLAGDNSYPQSALPSSTHPADGYPPFEQLAKHYAAVRGIDVPDMSWYLAFAAYKLAVILEGIHFRYRAGQTVGEGFDRIGELVTPLARTGLALLAKEA